MANYLIDYLIPKRHVKTKPSICDPLFVRINLWAVISLVRN